MNNLHRELAPISDAAWADIEEETTRTLKRHLAGRRVVDVHSAAGVSLSAVGTGHLKTIAAPGDGIFARQRDVKALVEFRVPFELDRQQIDDVERGANDSDCVPLSGWSEKLLGAGMPAHVAKHLSVMTELNKQGRYDRMTDDLFKLTGQKPISMYDFVKLHAAEFTRPEIKT